MKYIHQAWITVFCKEGENEELILKKLMFLVPLDFEKEKIKINRTSAEGFGNKKIIIFEVELKKEKHTNTFLENLRDKLNEEQKKLLLRQAESRLDNNLDFFIRLDKEKLLNEDTLWLTDSGNCFHIKLSIAAFPVKRETALEVLGKIFK